MRAAMVGWLLVVVLAGGSVRAQAGIAGGGLALGAGFVPMLSFQVGGEVVPHAETRLTVDAFAAYFVDIGVDVLYTSSPIGDPARWYVGGGPQVFLVPIAGLYGGGGPFAAAGFHATGGLALRVAPGVEAYMDVQPSTDFGLNVFMANVRIGVEGIF